MMERFGGIAWKTGAFVMLGLALATLLLFTVRNPRLFQQGYEIRVLIDSAGGLSAGTPVKFAGADVGEVQRIAIRSPLPPGQPPIELVLWLSQGLTLYADDQVLVGMLGILGEKYVELLPGPQRTQSLQPGDALVAVSPITEVQMTQQLARTLEEFERALVRVNQLDVDLEPWLTLKGEVESSLQQANRMLEQLEQTAQRAQALLEQWQEAGTGAGRLWGEAARWLPWVAAAGVALLALLIWR